MKALWKIVWAPFAVVAAHAMLAAMLRTVRRRQVVAVVVVCAVALLWEVGEFTWQAVTGTRIQFGTRDTLTDLGLGAAGAVVGAFVSVGRGVGNAEA